MNPQSSGEYLPINGLLIGSNGNIGSKGINIKNSDGYP